MSFLHFELTQPSCLVVTCIFPVPYTRPCHQLRYPGLSTQITSRLAIAITGARASFPLRRHLASVKAQGRGESKPVDAGTFPSMVFVWVLPRHWPKAIHLGGGTVTVFVDERANEEQRRALENIALGKLGGLPFEILATTFSAVQETRFIPFEFLLAGRNSAARIGDSVAFDLEPVKNPVTGEPEFVRIEHATGFIFRGAEVVSARELRVSAGTINFQYSDKAGFVTEVHYQN